MSDSKLEPTAATTTDQETTVISTRPGLRTSEFLLALLALLLVTFGDALMQYLLQVQVSGPASQLVGLAKTIVPFLIAWAYQRQRAGLKLAALQAAHASADTARLAADQKDLARK